MLRRLEKRILVDLPTQEARKAMFMHHLPPVVCRANGNGLELDSDLDYELLAEVIVIVKRAPKQPKLVVSINT